MEKSLKKELGKLPQHLRNRVLVINQLWQHSPSTIEKHLYEVIEHENEKERQTLTKEEEKANKDYFLFQKILEGIVKNKYNTI